MRPVRAVGRVVDQRPEPLDVGLHPQEHAADVGVPDEREGGRRGSC
jgi:hypothetical protein